MNKKRGGEMGDHKNLIWAIALSGLILFAFDGLLVPMLGGKPAPEVATAVDEANAETAVVATEATAPAPEEIVPPAEAVDVTLHGQKVDAVINTRGARVVTWTLKGILDDGETSAPYQVLSEEGDHAAQLSTRFEAVGLAVPDETTVWRVASQGDDWVELVYETPEGLLFSRKMALGGTGYTLTLTDTVASRAPLPVLLSPVYAFWQKGGYRKGELSSFVNYFGPMGVVGSGDDFLVVEEGYKDLKKMADRGVAKVASTVGDGGWWGFTSHFFAMAFVPASESERWFAHELRGQDDWYGALLKGESLTLTPGAAASTSMEVYLGPKQHEFLDAVGHNLSRAIDWGWFKAIAKPLHTALVWLHGYVGNWGLAIIALTFLLKLALFPLANKSYRAMAKMRKLQPEMEALKKKHGKDQQAMATAMMAMYAKEKVNPLSGCWPMIVQIPIFFAMYKVVLVSFEFRHAPLGLWITDLSVYDPIYVLPLLMGASMWAQMQMQPKSPDPVQAMVFKWMPVIFTVMFLWFPAALVLYWLVNNVISVAQQYVIMRAVK
ncbi:MAG: membrane protein insertase YidC [Alphaproteobacteria bacterium CG_4_10_14_0_8_um_filter_53_9]|nr:MAG: membrane protein insertase YidC [Alphaproteobacteria bacterium CG_4_10_14_0_8_um_filter_53_9]